MPGYHTPGDTTKIAHEIMAALIRTWRRAETTTAETAFEAHLAEHRDRADDPLVPTATLRRALTFWTRLHGVISLELAGQFTGMGFDPALLYESEVEALLADAI